MRGRIFVFLLFELTPFHSLINWLVIPVSAEVISSSVSLLTSTNLTLTVPSGQSSKEFFFYIEIAVEFDNSDATATAVGTRGRTLNITGDSFFVDESTGAGSDSSVGDIDYVTADATFAYTTYTIERIIIGTTIKKQY